MLLLHTSFHSPSLGAKELPRVEALSTVLCLFDLERIQNLFPWICLIYFFLKSHILLFFDILLDRKKQANLKGFSCITRTQFPALQQNSSIPHCLFSIQMPQLLKKLCSAPTLSLIMEEWGPQNLHIWGAHKCESKVLLENRLVSNKQQKQKPAQILPATRLLCVAQC